LISFKIGDIFRKKKTFFVNSCERKACVYPDSGGGKQVQQKADKRREPVQSRTIEIHIYDLGDHQVNVEGQLRDRRMVPPRGSIDHPALIHHLIARLWVRGPDLTITAAEAEMKQVPRNSCPEILPGLQHLVGLRIITGYTQKVKELIGGVSGCSHLTNLILTMGPAAVQGYWAAYGRKPGARSLTNPAILRVIDSCHVWRKDGPLAQSLENRQRNGGTR
jgi:hypothetical protein